MALATALPTVRIERHSGWGSLRLGEIWEFRELFYFLAWRDVKVRYKQTVLGASWAIIQPLLSMLIFTVLFGRLANIPSDDIPYPVFSYAALLPWIFFSNGLGLASNSLVGSANLLTKVYFPRLIVPASAIMSGLVDLAVGLMLMPPMMWYFGIGLHIQILWTPVFVFVAFCAALGTGLWLSALNVQYRDVRYLVPFLTQFWMFATPVIYPTSLLAGPWQTLFALNPMVGVIEGFRWALLAAPLQSRAVIVSAVSAMLILASGVFYFRRVERVFADVV
jgi:lipopolysaccharide transport system permease protein